MLDNCSAVSCTTVVLSNKDVSLLHCCWQAEPSALPSPSSLCVTFRCSDSDPNPSWLCPGWVAGALHPSHTEGMRFSSAVTQPVLSVPKAQSNNNVSANLMKQKIWSPRSSLKTEQEISFSAGPAFLQRMMPAKPICLDSVFTWQKSEESFVLLFHLSHEVSSSLPSKLRLQKFTRVRFQPAMLLLSGQNVVLFLRHVSFAVLVGFKQLFSFAPKTQKNCCFFSPLP